MIPWAAAIVFSMSMAYFSDKLQNRFAFVVTGLCFAIPGNLILFTIHHNREAEFAGLVLYTMGVICMLPVLICWFSMNMMGHKNRAVATAWQIGIGNVAGIIAPFAYPHSDAPHYHTGYSLGLGCLCLSGVASTAYFIGCLVENKRRARDNRLIL